MTTCEACGHANDGTAHFCTRCGTTLKRTARDPRRGGLGPGPLLVGVLLVAALATFVVLGVLAADGSTDPRPQPASPSPEHRQPETSPQPAGEQLPPEPSPDDPSIAEVALEAELAALLLEFHAAVVERRFRDAWDLLSARKQSQFERRDGYAAWRRAQASMSSHLEPDDLVVSLEELDEQRLVATVRVQGMTWSAPGSPCSSWSGTTWAKHEEGGWRYDPGYTTTPQRERRWEGRRDELLGVGC